MFHAMESVEMLMPINCVLVIKFCISFWSTLAFRFVSWPLHVGSITEASNNFIASILKHEIFPTESTLWKMCHKIILMTSSIFTFEWIFLFNYFAFYITSIYTHFFYSISLSIFILSITLNDEELLLKHRNIMMASRQNIPRGIMW